MRTVCCLRVPLPYVAGDFASLASQGWITNPPRGRIIVVHRTLTMNFLLDDESEHRCQYISNFDSQIDGTASKQNVLEGMYWCGTVPFLRSTSVDNC